MSLSPEELIFHDGLGDRLLIRDAQGRPAHESLMLPPELSSAPSFEFSLNQRLTQLDKFNHPSFVPVRGVVRAHGPAQCLSVVSDYVVGTRLSEVLASYESSGKRLSTSSAFSILREILDAVSVLHRQSGDIAHGALSPERIILEDGKVRIADYVLGSAIEQLHFSPERYWKELRVAVPSAAGGSRLDRRVDVAQVGMIAVALLAGRPLRDAEHIGRLGDVLTCLTQQVGGQRQPLSVPLRGWLLKALHMDSRRTFVSAAEARQGFDEVLAETGGVTSSGAELEVIPAAQWIAPAATVKSESPKPITLAPLVKRPVLHQATELQSKARDAWDSHNASPQTQTMYRGSTNVNPQPDHQSRLTRRMKGFLKIGVFGALIAGAFTAAQFIPPPAFLFASSGTLVIESKPGGVEVLVDGKPHGVTPMTLRVESGKHEVELRGNGKPRVFNLWVSSGDRMVQYVEFPARLK
jgi:serine/threonine protein kinase